MRASQYFIPTLKEAPAEAEVPSHIFLIRAGYIRQLAAGLYEYLPLGFRVLKKIENIIRKYMDDAGALEVLLPILTPAELWQETGRWDVYGKELFRVEDRKGRLFALGPTHEETITDLVRKNIRSYKDLPKNFYQIQTKFRDEARPRYGLIRGREFLMKDAYSFDVSEEMAVKSYETMKETYRKIFDELGFDYLMVEADTGAIGGKFSHEFVVKVPNGEAHIVYCEKCGYAANIEAAKYEFELDKLPPEEEKPLEKVHTPSVSSVEDVSRFLGVDSKKIVKTLVYILDDGTAVAVLIRGDRELNETKLINYFNAIDAHLASSEELERLGIVEGFVGPIGLNIPVYADVSVKDLHNFVVGANEKDYHFINVNIPRDFKPVDFVDFSTAKEGDPCPVCKSPLKEATGLEVGHIFLLGTKYSESMKAYFVDKDGREKPIIMGCYGIGVSRLMAAAVEQNHDENGIIWPESIAPFKLHILALNIKDNQIKDIAEKIYDEAKKLGVEVLYDDRDISPGAKFKDADLIGIPYRVVVGKKVKEGKVEFQERKTGNKEEIEIDKINELLKRLL
ncbi:prolyl-tRNA synthetase [Persephonella hydrogeniphila]|uniref:Proline--tRNA ligase n=1 Tax=Persephonella hydrogeniphila TaxID=198703 RepID=A0A285NB17_9AQUI|nr:proline--tRNA ligase [Persephonella hydrogeniphila]SNZ06684.1 prolyl-tRNA synthetase [Persephonella hydrogeniphila]